MGKFELLEGIESIRNGGKQITTTNQQWKS